MSSNGGRGVVEEDSSQPKESSSINNGMSTKFDLQSLLMKIQADVAQKRQVLASSVADRMFIKIVNRRIIQYEF